MTANKEEYARPFFWRGGSHAVLLTHGFTGTAAHMRPLGERLRDAGFTVKGILLPGHGTQLEDMRRCTWQQWLQAQMEAVRELRDEYPLVSVAGLSMGGDLALIAAEQTELTACVTLSAPMKTRARFTSLARPLSVLKPTIHWRKSGGAKRPMSEYNIGYAAFPTAKVYDLKYLMRLARRNLYGVTCPLLTVQSRTDHTISADSADIIQKGALNAKKEMLWIAQAPHVCVLSPALDQIADTMIAFLRQAEHP